MSGFVYFVGCRSIAKPLVKIGFTRSPPELRLRQLQTGNGDQLVLFGYRRGSMADERELHAQFAAYRTYGEWFLAEDDVCHRLEKLLEVDCMGIAGAGHG